MKNNFDIKKFLIENKITLNSKNINEQDNFKLDDEDMRLAKGLNVTYLKVGDYITNDMWNSDSNYFFHTDEPSLILAIGIDDDGPYVKFSDYWSEYELEEVNNNLKPEYQIEEPLDESFELGDDDVKLAKNLNFFKVNFTKQAEEEELNDMYDELGGERGMTPEQILIMDAGQLNQEGFFDNEVGSLEEIAKEIVDVQGGTVEKWLEALNDMVDLGIIEIYK